MAEPELLPLFCEKCGAAGLPINRGLMFMDTLHPVHEGRIVRWRNDGVDDDGAIRDYGPSNQGEAAAAWQRSPFFHVLQTGGEELRRRIGFGDPADYLIIQEMKDAGHTDYVLFVHRFAAEGTIGEMDCFYSGWSTRHPYTRALIAAIPDPFHRAAVSARAKAKGEIASALDPPSGCHFHPRCPLKAERCTMEVPALDVVAAGHRAACHFRERTD